MSRVNLDETDAKVLRQIIDDPRASIADIARNIGVQRDTVKYRIERFEKRGLVMKYHTILDPAALGCEVFMLVLIKTAPISRGVLQNFVERLQVHKNVTHIARLVGKYDYMLQMAAPDIVAFDAALDEIKSFETGIITEIELANLIDGIKIDDFGGLI